METETMELDSSNPEISNEGSLDGPSYIVKIDGQQQHGAD